MATQPGSFQQVLSAAIDDLITHGFDSVDRIARWTHELRQAAERSLTSASEMDLMLRDALAAIYRRMIDRGQIFKMNPGVERFTLDRVRTALRGELDRRIVASAQLIKLNRDEAIEKTLRRFQGWSTSIPKGGTSATKKGESKQEIRKSIAGLPFVERRVIIDQGMKLVSSLNDILAKDGGAIAGLWVSHYRQIGYQYRPDHKERDYRENDGQPYLIRDSWAHQAGLVKKGKLGYADEVTAPATEPFCRCYYRYLYHLRELPRDMLTEKGKTALASARGAEEVRSARTARADANEPKKDKTEVKYRGPFAERPGHQRCDGCTMFRAPSSCTAVSGLIDPGGWCELFEPVLVLAS
jgi:hypothetical protein